MSDVFAQSYAEVYDSLYAEKDYARECDLIERLLAEHGVAAPARILDLGCGTGNHSLPLAARGHAVTGVDRSSAMLALARAKSSEGAVRFAEGNLGSIRLDETYDAALMMFSVLGYQHSNADVQAALETACAHLRPGGLLLFDFWYGPAVLRQRPGTRTREVPLPDGSKLVRTSRGQLDTRGHLVRVEFDLSHERGGDTVETHETHLMRYFFPLELELYFGHAGLELVQLTDFPGAARDPDEETWNVIAVARRSDVS